MIKLRTKLSEIESKWPGNPSRIVRDAYHDVKAAHAYERAIELRAQNPERMTGQYRSVLMETLTAIKQDSATILADLLKEAK